MDAIGGVVAVVSVVSVLWLWMRARASRPVRDGRAALALQLGGLLRADGQLDLPARRGRAVVTYTTEPGAEHDRSWTYVEVALPPAYPLALYLRPHTYTDALAIQRGEMVDLQLGDPAIDAAYLVEGAPADVVVRLFTPEVRAMVTRWRPVKIDVVRGVLQVVQAGTVKDPDTLGRLVALAAALAGGVRDAYASADAAVPVAPAGGPYREIPGDEPLQRARMARFAEVQRLGEIQRARGYPVMLLLFLFGLGTIGLLLVGSGC